jgi:hypothetical protein
MMAQTVKNHHKGIYSAFNGNEYQKIFLGAIHGRRETLTTICESIVYEM